MKTDYTWRELRPIHPLLISILVAEVIGAVVHLVLQGTGHWQVTIWVGGAFASFPGFLFGLLAQMRLRPWGICALPAATGFLGLATALLFAASIAVARTV